MFYLHQSTCPQTLFEAFADRLHRSRSGVFDRATVIVPSMTVRDDLDNRLADRHGISALLDAKFFGMFSWALVEKVTQGDTPDSHPPLSRTAMQWRMFAEFAARPDAPPQNAMDTFLAGLTAETADPDARLARLWQLAGQFARLFVRYIHMRADWLDKWSGEQGATLPELFAADEMAEIAAQPDWMHAHYQHICAAQQAVWQHCFADAYRARAARLERFWQILAREPVGLPDPLFVYALESVDADMYGFLLRLGQYTDIHVYHQAVSDGYFGDMVDDRWLRRLPHKEKDKHYDSIHPLLSRFGKQQRDIFRQWIAPPDDGARVKIDLLAPHPEPRTLLATLQKEIRDLNPTLLRDHTPDPQDDSLRIHACHGLMRQLEALRGELARWFAADPSRRPADVLIVLPELDDAQNLVRTVFPPDGEYDGYRLPARLTGITPPAAHNLWQAIEGLHTLPDSRFEAGRVLAWLRREEVCAMLGIAPAAMNRLCEALVEAGYRRGLDAGHLGNTDGDPRFTFCYALDRLITGLWMPDAPQYRQTVPYPQHDSHGIDALCRLALHWQEAHRTRHERRPVRAWVMRLQQELAGRFPAPDNAQRTVELALRELDGQMAALEAHAPAPPVPLAFVLADIGARLSAEHTGSEPSGVMTIGRLNAMRTLSYKLIAFVGANTADFPANPPDDRYDLTRLGKKRPGDLNPEHEDLAAFLDILRHAREALWVFYDRYPPGSGEEQPPAQPVQEILNYLHDQDIDSTTLIRAHPATPFYEEETDSHAPHDHHPAPLWQQIRDSAANRSPDRPFVALEYSEIPLEAPLDDAQTLDFDELRRTLTRPLAAYLHARDIAIQTDSPAEYTLEPLHLDPLETHALDSRLIAGADDERLIRLPLLPAGAAGQALHAARLDALAQRRAQLLAAAGNIPELPVLRDRTVRLDNITVTVPLPEPGAPHLILHAGTTAGKHRLNIWLRHLLRQQADGRGDTWCAFRDGICRHRAVDDPARHLRAWLNVYRNILQKPWLLPLEIGMAWADGDTADENAARKILQKWRDSGHPADAPAAFALITRAYAPEQVDALILAYARTYAPALYRPIAEHTDTVRP